MLPRSFAVLALALGLTLAGCKDDAPAAAGPAAQAKASPAPTDAPVANPQANPHALPQHAGPMGSGPGLAHGSKPLGPPRDVTPSGETRAESVDELGLQVPSEWERGPGSNSMRKAEFVLPGPGGDVQLVVYRFAGGAGSADANIERWKGQVTVPEGSEAQTSELEAGGMKITTVDLSGAYAGQSMPGAPPQPPIADARMLAAAIMGPGDPFYLKLVGPSATVDLWAPAWTKLLEEATSATAAEGEAGEGEAAEAEAAPPAAP